MNDWLRRFSACVVRAVFPIRKLVLSIGSFGSRVIKHGYGLPYDNENGKALQLLNLTCCGLGFTDKRGVRVRETVLELYKIKNDARLWWFTDH